MLTPLPENPLSAMSRRATERPKTATVLVVLDGWGIDEPAPDNAIHLAHTPHWDRLWATAPRSSLDASGASVGLPPGQMGNSEVGHMTIGAGRVIHQDLSRIDQAIASGEFQANAVLNDAIAKAANASGALHVLGLLSPGGVHSHEAHIAALLRLAQAKHPQLPLRLHAFLDGRDTPPRSALVSLRRIEQNFPGVLASICGRYYAMDRDRRWDRTQRALALVQSGQAPFAAATAEAALQAAYDRGETDEFVQPTLVGAGQAAMQDGDAALFMNFRADRARQLTRALTASRFDDFTRPAKVRFAAFATLAQYAEDLPLPAAFPPAAPQHTLGECVAKAGGTQLRLAETEKYAHVTYFFSGGREQPFPGEERVLVPSPTAATYDLTPAMSASALTDRLVAAIEAGRNDLIVCNYANGDMVGHTGVLSAATQAVEAVDAALGRLLGAVREAGAQCLITADHGNVERMADDASGQPHTAHTAALVPFVYAGPRSVRLLAEGTLADVAPTLLTLLDLPQPAAMTGKTLLADAAPLAAA